MLTLVEMKIDFKQRPGNKLSNKVLLKRINELWFRVFMGETQNYHITLVMDLMRSAQLHHRNVKFTDSACVVYILNRILHVCI